MIFENLGRKKMKESIKEKNSLADNKKTRFGTESIPKLLISLAIPAIIANLVNALYIL